MKTQVRYVVGFMFSSDRTCVALIRKQKPTWQYGKLNGIGGKVEPMEEIKPAMVREFREETGCETTPDQWFHFLEMSGTENAFRVDFFTTFGDVTRLTSMESEKVEVIRTEEINVLRGFQDMVENLPWLIALALDYLHDGRPTFVVASYP